MTLVQEIEQTLRSANILPQSQMNTEQYSLTVIRKGVRIDCTPFNHTTIMNVLANRGYNVSKPYVNPSKVLILNK